MVAAASRGLIDFRQADPLDRRWWLRLRLVLDHIEAEHAVRRQERYYEYDLAVLSRDTLTDGDGRKFLQDANRRLARIDRLRRPWDREDPERQARAASELSAAWAREYGDPNSPETKAAIDQTVRLLEKLDKSRKRPAHAPIVLR